ncbi:MAG: ribosome biogenesis GTPase Der [Xanthomonadales bacterium]|nr:ribosome biogenesis GTPase Der [Xanthomonadales bacterium]ODU74357.1 MAG: ribosome biogenesis GTPase Der [Rhodanobacter sp. SCN 69-32]OJY84153.1 MAG: ribosome biogenesis GTPase Der [Xanthomonadales bacterium 66-474]
MLPVVALVGRPNVGKSTLFNALTKTRDALVADLPGVTRDRHYGVCRIGARPFVLVDTGGLSGERVGIDPLTEKQVQFAIDEAAVCVLLADAREGLLPQDRVILDRLRRTGKPVLLAVNKTDGLDAAAALAEFSTLGVAASFAIAAAHARGLDALLAAMLPLLPPDTDDEATAGHDESTGTRVAIVGRPNVGKSTLVNRLLGEERVVVSDIAGTTRDSIHVPLERDGRRYTLIDTAGVRRRGRVDEALEKFSVIKTLQSIAAADVAAVMLDAGEGVTDQDLALIGQVLEAGRALVIVANKWDGLEQYDRERCKAGLERKLDFVAWAKIVFLSAKHGSGLRELMRAIDRAGASATRQLGTSDLTRSLEKAVAAHQPPLVRGHSPKLRFAHPGGERPPTIVIHGTRTKHIADSYRRYLENFFRKRYKLEGTPIRIEFREGENPYAGKRNAFTESQQRKRRRMIRHVRGR